MTLCDSGPLFALIDPRQVKEHARCRACLGGLLGPLICTWPCFTEAMHFAQRQGGWRMQDLLWDYVREGRLLLHEHSPREAARMAVLMERYRNVPMDLADASLVAVAESTGLSRIFTLDSGFHVYRIGDVDAFEVVPS